MYSFILLLEAQGGVIICVFATEILWVKIISHFTQPIDSLNVPSCRAHRLMHHFDTPRLPNLPCACAFWRNTTTMVADRYQHAVQCIHGCLVRGNGASGPGASRCPVRRAPCGLPRRSCGSAGLRRASICMSFWRKTTPTKNMTNLLGFAPCVFAATTRRLQGLQDVYKA